MGDYAQDEIDKGMMSDRPFRYSRNRHRCVSTPGEHGKSSVPVAPGVSDDEFTWWFDSQNWTTESPYEMAAAAWHEVAKRCGVKGN